MQPIKLSETLQYPVTRKRFLQLLGTGLLSLLGLSSVLKLLDHSTSSRPSFQGGYGSSAYGGVIRGAKGGGRPGRFD